MLDVSEVADYLRISRSSVYKLIERQQIPAIRIWRLLRVRKDELDKTLRSMAAVSKKARNGNVAIKRDGISPKRLARFWNYWQLLASRPIITVRRVV